MVESGLNWVSDLLTLYVMAQFWPYRYQHLLQHHMKKYILVLLDLNWNMVVIFGITVTKEIRKNWRIFN